ncbi:hypothetical protein Q5P01_000896 [Channa striata]|uniref:Ig-like domain-containing protein n=1 Tax=Channa striata TaxID=64152 RepID=A0AA88LM68_CHASR|nr:hypothetical protein Q5P01_000896 [Channa striata]
MASLTSVSAVAFFIRLWICVQTFVEIEGEGCTFCFVSLKSRFDGETEREWHEQIQSTCKQHKLHLQMSFLLLFMTNEKHVSQLHFFFCRDELINKPRWEFLNLILSAYPGDTVTLPCRPPNNTNITAVEWIRPDLEPKYVFVYQNQHFNMSQQHPSFENRVELKDSEMKDGDVSLILKNVTSRDTGTYYCYAPSSSWNAFVNMYVHPVVINITAEPGQNVTLPCEWPSIMSVFGVKFIRPDLDPGVVWFTMFDEDMMDGWMTLILKNVTINDNGIYYCYVYSRRTIFIHGEPALTSVITLDVCSLASTAPAPPGLSVLRIIVHLVVFCPYVLSTLLMVSLCGHRPTERNLPISTMTSPTSDDDDGPDTQYDYVTADVTTEHRF